MVSTEACDDGSDDDIGCALGCSGSLDGNDCILLANLTTQCTPICGDSKRVAGEGCDDGIPLDGLGCLSDCTNHMPGYTCTGGTLTTADTCFVPCGDGLVAGSENCDDGSDDSEGCQIGCLTGSYPTWICTGGDPYSPTSCIPNCGDGILVGNETCDTNTTY